MTYKLELPYPPSANKYWRTRKGSSKPYVSDEAKKYKAVAWKIAMLAGVRKTSSAVELKIGLQPRQNKDGSASKTCIDLDNCLKVTLDALNNLVYWDDKQVKRIEVEYLPPVPEGGLLVEVLQYG